MKRRATNRMTRRGAKQLRNALSIRRGEHGEEARQALHHFILNWAAGGWRKKNHQPQG